MPDMKRRKFIALLGGAAAGWPLRAGAQQREKMRRIGVLMNLAADDAEGQARLAAFLQGLQEAGWAVGRNVRVDLRWGAGDADRIRKQAAELVALAPDVVLASGIPAATPLLQVTRTVPIVFAQVVDPVGAGLVASLARPGGNATGFTFSEIWDEREMGGTTQGDRAWRDAGSGASGCCQYLRDRLLGRDPVRGFLVRDGVDPGRGERRRRDRARRHRIRARLQRRPDYDGEHVDHRSSRADYQAGGSAPTACGL
jgi:hypothetical protein